MSLRLEKAAFAQSLGDSSAKIVLLAMCHVSAEGEVWVDRKKLMAMTDLAESTVRLKKAQLIKQGLIRRIGRNRYFITLAETLLPAGLPPESSDQTLNPSGQPLNPSAKMPDSSAPYIRTEENEKKRKLTRVKSHSHKEIVIREHFVEAADMKGIPRQAAGRWYDNHEECGWFYNQWGHLKPFATDLKLMLRRCKEHKAEDREKISKNKSSGEVSSSEVYSVEARLKFIQKQIIKHPGDPGREMEVAPDSPERAEWWELVEKEKKLKALMNKLIPK